MSSPISCLPIPLLEDIIENRCIPIIGAGFSRNAVVDVSSKMPLWKDVGKYFAEQMKGYEETNPLECISAFSYEYSRAKTIEELRRILFIDSSSPGVAHTTFAELPFDFVITTNFDFLLERAYESIRNPYYPIVREEQLSINNSNKILNTTPTRIIKIHGDFNNPDKMVITEDDYDLFLSKNPLLSTFISNLLITRTPLFIGYSFDDPDFRTIWQIISSRLGKLRRNAYVIRQSSKKFDNDKFERRGVKVISLMSE